MDDAGNRRIGLVADGIGAFLWRCDQFRFGRNELARDGIERIGAVDQIGNRIGDRDRIARGEGREGGNALRCNQACIGERARRF
jgi:hypothetical protein